jgi:hypothetical protein
MFKADQRTITVLPHRHNQRQLAERSRVDRQRGPLQHTGVWPTTVTSDRPSPAARHVGGGRFAIAASSLKRNVIVCGVAGCVHPRHSKRALDAASTAADRNSPSTIRLSASPALTLLTLPSGRTATWTSTFPRTIADSAIGG